MATVPTVPECTLPALHAAGDDPNARSIRATAAALVTYLADAGQLYRQALEQLAEIFDARNAALTTKLQTEPPPRVAATSMPDEPVTEDASEPRVQTEVQHEPEPAATTMSFQTHVIALFGSGGRKPSAIRRGRQRHLWIACEGVLISPAGLLCQAILSIRILSISEPPTVLLEATSPAAACS